MSQDGLPMHAGQQTQPAIYVFAGEGFNGPMFDALRAMMGGQPPQAVPAPGSDAAGGAATPEQPKERREPLPRGEAERRVLLLLQEHPDTDYTPGQIAREIDARGCRDLMARLHARGIVELVNEHPITYRAARPKPRRSRAKNKQ